MKTSSQHFASAVLCLLLGLSFSESAAGQGADAQSSEPPSVGESRTIQGLFLPGSELQPKPLTDDRQPIVLRIVNAFPQGTLGFRYDIRYTGYEPGEFDLRDYMERIDRTSAGELPRIPVSIRSVLPPGQVQPNELPDRGVPRLGGYRQGMWIAIILWLWVLSALVLLGWKNKKRPGDRRHEKTLAELLQPRIQAARDKQLDARQYAELERMLIAMWQRKLNLANDDPSGVVSQIRRHPESGPLMRQLERWMHDPARDETIDLQKLLEPLSRISATEFQSTFESAQNATQFASSGQRQGI